MIIKKVTKITFKKLLKFNATLKKLFGLTKKGLCLNTKKAMVNFARGVILLA